MSSARGGFSDRRTRLFGGSGELLRDIALGSSLTRSGGVSTSFPFPLSFLFGLPARAAGSGGGSKILTDEFDLEREGSLSTTIVGESESNAIG